MLTGKLDIDRERMYSTKETCKILGCCYKTLWKYTKSLDLVASVHPTGKIRYKGSDIEKFWKQSI